MIVVHQKIILNIRENNIETFPNVKGDSQITYLNSDLHLIKTIV